MTRIPLSLLEGPGVLQYLKKRNLISQYKKAKNNILEGFVGSAQFRLRKPYSAGVWYFRINRKYRAFGYFDGDQFVVTTIYDHQ